MLLGVLACSQGGRWYEWGKCVSDVGNRVYGWTMDRGPIRRGGVPVGLPTAD